MKSHLDFVVKILQTLNFLTVVLDSLNGGFGFS